MAEKDVTDQIERLEAFEDRMGVTLTGLFASSSDKSDGSDYFISVNGEIHPQDGTELQQDVELVVTAYDSSGRVIALEDRSFYQDDFFGFEAFSIILNIEGIPTARIRIYPKAR